MRRRRRVGHAPALSGKGRDAGADSGIRSFAGEPRGSRRCVEVAAADQADQRRAPHRRRPHQAGIARRADRREVGDVARVGVRCDAGRGDESARGERRRGRAEAARSPPDARAVRQHRARSARRLQQAGGAVPAGGLRRRVQESADGAGHAAAARRNLQHVGRAAGAERVPHRRHQRARALQAASIGSSDCRSAATRSCGGSACARSAGR